MTRLNRFIAAATALSIITTTLMYAYGASIDTLETFLSFGSLDLAAKTLLGIAMLIIVFFARPRSELTRIFLGTLASLTLAYAAFGAFSQTLALGDTLLFFIGSFIAMTETIEAKFSRPHRPAFPQRRTTGA